MYKNLTFKCFGAEGETCQISRIKDGFLKLGLEESDSPNFIYCNDVGKFDEAIKYKENYSLPSYLILNVLDIPIHIIEHYNLNKVKSQLLKADKITTISYFVKTQIKSYFNLDSEVIYNPIQNIYKDKPDNKYSNFKYLIAGRVNDPNKHTKLALESLFNLKATNDEVLCVGPENPGFGTYLGIVNEIELNKIYNSVKFVFCLGEIEGLGLQKFESIISNNCIPIILNHETTLKEFELDKFININPFPQNIINFINMYDSIENFNDLKNILFSYYSDFIESNLRGISVAQKIVDIFEKSYKV